MGQPDQLARLVLQVHLDLQDQQAQQAQAAPAVQPGLQVVREQVVQQDRPELQVLLVQAVLQVQREQPEPVVRVDQPDLLERPE